MLLRARSFLKVEPISNEFLVAIQLILFEQDKKEKLHSMEFDKLSEVPAIK